MVPKWRYNIILLLNLSKILYCQNLSDLYHDAHKLFYYWGDVYALFFDRHSVNEHAINQKPQCVHCTILYS